MVIPIEDEVEVDVLTTEEDDVVGTMEEDTIEEDTMEEATMEEEVMLKEMHLR